MKVQYSNSWPKVCNGSTSINVGFVAEKVEVSQVLVRLFRFYSVNFYSIMFHVLAPTKLGLNMVKIRGHSPTDTQGHSTVGGRSKQLVTLISGYQNPKI
jgi:hypothetical protein